MSSLALAQATAARTRARSSPARRRDAVVRARAKASTGKTRSTTTTRDAQPSTGTTTTSTPARAVWWPVDARTGKPPWWFQLVVFAASQVFVGTVMQPAAMLWARAFEPFARR